jgi:hypothetical protein
MGMALWLAGARAEDRVAFGVWLRAEQLMAKAAVIVVIKPPA